jgi:hypothetical protein
MSNDPGIPQDPGPIEPLPPAPEPQCKTKGHRSRRHHGRSVILRHAKENPAAWTWAMAAIEAHAKGDIKTFGQCQKELLTKYGWRLERA